MACDLLGVYVACCLVDVVGAWGVVFCGQTLKPCVVGLSVLLYVEEGQE